MKRILLPVVMMLMVFSSAIAQKEKVVYGDNVVKREIGSFHAVETSSGIEVIMSKGDKEELAVSVDNNTYLNEVRTVVENGVLKISRSTDWKFWTQWKSWRVKVYISYVDIDGIKASSGGSVSVTDLNLAKLSVRMSSGGSVSLAGNVKGLDVDGSSGAQFKGYSLTADNCKVEVSSGAGIQVTVDKEISAHANSGGFVHFKGEGLIRDINVNSGGSVRRQS
jgi:preprotein translocase subunit YajC